MARAMLHLAIGAALLGLFLLWLGSRPPHRPGALSVPASQQALLMLFRRADAFEVYTRMWPGYEGRPHLLGVVRRDDDRQRWQRWLEDLRHPREVGLDQSGPTIYLRPVADTTRLGEVECMPRQARVVLRRPGHGRAELEFPSSLHELLLGFEQRTQAARLQASKQQPVPGAPGPPEARCLFVPGPAARSFDEAKARLVKLFRECTYVNIAGLRGNTGLDVRTECRTQWEQMTRAVTRASKGWAIPGPPEMHISPERPDRVGVLVVLDYDKGVLGCSDPYYGADVHTIRPADGFDAAVRSLREIAKEKDQREAR